MNRTEAVERLKACAGALKERGATSLYLYGSTAGDQAGTRSDLDLFLDYDPQSRFNAFDLVAARRLLQDGMGLDVDLTTRAGLHPLIRERIETEAVRIF